MRLPLIMFLVLLCSCGALKKTKRIDRVRQSASIEANTSVKTDEKIKTEDKSVKTEKVSEKSDNSVITEREIFFDDSGRVNYIKEKVIETRQREKQKENMENSDMTTESEKKSESSLDFEVNAKVDSLKKDTQLEQPENSVWGWIGAGILAVFLAVGIVIFLRFRK